MKEQAERKLSRVDHLAIAVADIAKSVAWYQTSFSCRVVYQELTEALLEFDNIRLALVLPSQQPAHVAFQRSDANTLGELRKQRDGAMSTFLSDPTGNVVEIVMSEAEDSV